MTVHTKKILIIEDERPMARALELKLMHAGYEAESVFNGEAGLEALTKGTYDIIICDLVMPKADGFQVLEEIKSRKITTPVLILTNLSQEEDEKKVLALGAKYFFVKSDTPIADIVEHVKKILQ